ncbi:TPA: hypothetical protein PXO92_002702 [Yersinia enterocolitica]|nr:hypothetical protein [Yersinia enterocolitica]
MTDEIKTGGLAFPFNDIGGNCDPGMTLHDYFAAKAMSAIVRRYDGHSFGGAPHYKELASVAYLIADAMLAARSK